MARDGSGDFTTIQQAIDGTKAFPHERITIRIASGVYEEKAEEEIRPYSVPEVLSPFPNPEFLMPRKKEKIQ